MKLKKIVSIIAVSAMSLALLAGCGSGDNSKENTTAAKTEAETTEAETTETQVTDAATEAETTEQDTTEADTTEDASAETGKTLVVYYSATGSTRAVAQVAADTLGADLFEITPVEPYSSDDLNWTNDDSRVSREHNDESLRDVELTQVTPENWDSYDTVLIGYPIWWQHGLSITLSRVMISLARQLSRSAHQHHQVLATVDICLNRWQEPETGRKDRDSAQVRQSLRLLTGLTLSA